MVKRGEVMAEADKLQIVYGMFDLKQESELARASWKYVQKDLSDIKNRYISLGFHLKEIERMKYYEDFGYTDFYEFCEKNFKLDKSAISRCINVWQEFSMIQNGSRKMFLDEKYKDYSYSQLCELLPLDEKQRKKITPDMSVKQIREKKKEWKEKANSKKQKVATSQLKTDKKQEGCEDFLPCDNCAYDVKGCCGYPGTLDDYCVMGDKWVPIKESGMSLKQIGNSSVESRVDNIGQAKEEIREEPQPELPVMKNMQEREDFVNSYKSWNVWCRNEKTEQIFYRYDLPDGAAIVVLNYPVYVKWSKKETEEIQMFLLEPGYHHFMDCKASMTMIKEYLKNMQK